MSYKYTSIYLVKLISGQKVCMLFLNLHAFFMEIGYETKHVTEQDSSPELTACLSDLFNFDAKLQNKISVTLTSST